MGTERIRTARKTGILVRSVLPWASPMWWYLRKHNQVSHLKLLLNQDHIPDLHWQFAASANIVLLATMTLVHTVCTYSKSSLGNMSTPKDTNTSQSIAPTPYNLRPSK